MGQAIIGGIMFGLALMYDTGTQVVTGIIAGAAAIAVYAAFIVP